MQTGALRLCAADPESARRLRIGLIGAGRWGRQLLRVFSSLPRAELRSVCDLDGNRLTRLPSSLMRLRDYRDVLQSSEISAVIVATPPSMHAEITRAALAAGKHVFVEKPMATSLSDALAIRAAAAASGRRVMVGLVLHYHPAVVALSKLVRDGVLGRLACLYSERGGGRSPAAEHPAWWSLAPHDISLAQALFSARATRVSASRQCEGERERVSAAIRFDAGRRAELRLDTAPGERRRRVIVVGSAATAVFDDLERVHKLKLYRATDALGAASRDGIPDGGRDPGEVLRALARSPFEVQEVSEDEPLRLEAEHFVDSLATERPFVTDVDHAVDVVSALSAGELAMTTGTSAVVPEWRKSGSLR